jgi:hypothetical protein
MLVPLACVWVALRSEAGFAPGSIAGLTRPLGSAAAPHDCTPPCPRQAPDRFAPVKDVPSLQVAVTVPVLCAWAIPKDSKSPAHKATEKRKYCIGSTPVLLFIADQLP